MNIVTVKRYNQPRYPNKQRVLLDPQLLKTVPERWRGNLYVGTAVTTLLALTLVGCATKSVNDIKASLGNPVAAPIFEHGTGRGSFGCDSVAPPAFISEEEAFQVVQEEGKKYGISFKKDGLELKNVEIPETSYSSNSKDGSVVVPSNKGNLLLDGYDSAKKIAYEFISDKDYRGWSSSQGGGIIETYDYLTTAQVLKAGLDKERNDNTIGIFYNPMINIKVGQEADIKQLMAYDKTAAIKDLRMQVKDFLQWLKAQGIV